MAFTVNDCEACGKRYRIEDSNAADVERFCSIKCDDEFEDPDDEPIGDDYDDGEDYRGAPFADPGGNSALRAGPRIYPCPNCRQPNRLSLADKRLGYQCDACADRAERGQFFADGY